MLTGNIRINFLFVAVGMFFATLLCLLIAPHANAATVLISGTVRTAANNSLQGAYVYASDSGSSTIKYGPSLTASNGTYVFNIPVSGTYDVHFIAPLGSGHLNGVETGIQVGTTNYSLNKNLSYISQTYALSGRLTDATGTGIPNTTVRIVRVGGGSSTGTLTTTTNSNGDYSLSASPGNYNFAIESFSSSAITGIDSFKLQQSSAAGAINLSRDLSLNLTLQTATLSVQPHHNNGQPGNYPVTAYSRAGQTVLYPGDPGTNITQVYSQGSTGSSVPIKTIVGARYVAGGMDATEYFTTGICGRTSSTSYDCLRLPLEVTASQIVDVPQSSSATRTFSGTVVDGEDNPIHNARVRLVKLGDQTPTTFTNSGGEFSINAQPGSYALKVDGGTSALGNLSYEITQNGTYINLSNENVSKTLKIKTVSITINAFNSYGQPDYYKAIRANTSLGTTTLYDGDPGSSLVTSSGWYFTDSSNTANFITIHGAKYLAKGLGVYSSDANTNNSICKTTGLANTADCLTTERIVTEPSTIAVPQ